MLDRLGTQSATLGWELWVVLREHAEAVVAGTEEAPRRPHPHRRLRQNSLPV
jgi:hypothetical protein